MLHCYPMGYTKKLHTDHIHKLGFADPEHTKINTNFFPILAGCFIFPIPTTIPKSLEKIIPNTPGSPGHHPPLPPTLDVPADAVASLKVKSMSDTSDATLRKALPKACGRPASVGMPTWRRSATKETNKKWWFLYMMYDYVNHTINDPLNTNNDNFIYLSLPTYDYRIRLEWFYVVLYRKILRYIEAIL